MVITTVDLDDSVLLLWVLKKFGVDNINHDWSRWKLKLFLGYGVFKCLKLDSHHRLICLVHTPILIVAFWGKVQVFKGGVFSLSKLSINAQLAILVATICVNLTPRTQKHRMISSECYLVYNDVTVEEWPWNAEVTIVIVSAARWNNAEIFTKGENSTCWRFAKAETSVCFNLIDVGVQHGHHYCGALMDCYFLILNLVFKLNFLHVVSWSTLCS